MRGVYPGTFNPPTIGHIAIVEAALIQLDLVHLDLVVSRRPLAKDITGSPSLDQRIEVIRASVSHLEQVRVVATDHQLIADIAAGYDAVVMGADKWHQLHDTAFYESSDHRDRAMASLPRVAVAGRGQDPVPAELRLEVPSTIDPISSTGARAGRTGWMTPQAAASGLW